MRRNTALPIACLIGLVVAAAWGFSSIIGQRFSTGEAHPRYSSLRSDPLGTKALYDALNRMDGVTVSRHFRSLDKLDGGSGQTLLLLHVNPGHLGAGRTISGDAVRDFAVRGGRVVVTLNGQFTQWDALEKQIKKRRKENADKRKASKDASEKENKESSAEKAADKENSGPDSVSEEENENESESENEEEDEDEGLKRIASLSGVLELRAASRNFVMTPKGGVPIAMTAEAELPGGRLPGWYSHAVLKFAGDRAQENEIDPEEEEGEAAPPVTGNAKERWTVLATLEEDPDAVVLAERRFGRGSIVVATDSYFASNEALLKEPEPGFLSWLVGDAREIIFDEAHLGTTETPGIMTMARRLHLEGIFIGGLVLFALFVWQSNSSLIPPHPGPSGRASLTVAGQGAAAGLVSLLRRGIPRSRLLAKCVEVWETSARRQGTPGARIAVVTKVMSGSGTGKVPSRQVPRVYAKLCQAVHELNLPATAAPADGGGAGSASPQSPAPPAATA